MSDCKGFLGEIDEAADGRPVSAAGRAHAALCRACGEELRGRESLRALVGGLGKVEAPADFEFRLRARMAAAKGGGGHGRFGGRWLYGFAPVAVAACFVVVSATLYFRQAARMNTPGTPAVASAPARGAEPVHVNPVKDEKVVPAETTAAGERVAAANPASAVSSKPLRAAHRPHARAAQAREVASKGERRADVAPNTLVYSATGAQVLTLPMNASAEPMRVILRDERGAERVVSMRSVSFGSQSFLARDAAPRPSGAAEVGGVW